MKKTKVCIFIDLKKDLSIAENFLRLLRPDTKFTELEARVLDIALLLHMEHGGGNQILHSLHG